MSLFGLIKGFLVRLAVSLKLRSYRRDDRVAFVVLNLDASGNSKRGAMKALDKNNYRMETVKRDDSKHATNVLYSSKYASIEDRKKAVDIFFNEPMLPLDHVLTVYSWAKD